MKKIIDITNKRFGLLTAIKQVRLNGQLKWECKCDCGNIVYRQYRQLHEGEKNNRISSCGCTVIKLNGIPSTIVKSKVGDITIISYNNVTNLYTCQKGNEIIFLSSLELYNERRNFYKRKKRLDTYNTFAKKLNCVDYDDYKKKRYNLLGIFYSMKERCYSKKHKSYNNYGARGIKICDEWLNNSSAFVNWALFNGYVYGLQIDRINVNGDYCPDNCRFVTQNVNANNKTNNLYIDYQGKTQTLKQWCIELNLPYRQTHKRIYSYGWSIEKAFTSQSNNK